MNKAQNDQFGSAGNQVQQDIKPDYMEALNQNKGTSIQSKELNEHKEGNSLFLY